MFFFQLKICMWKSSKSAWFVQIKTKGFFAGESIPERSAWEIEMGCVLRTILHKSAMLVVVGYAHLSWKLEFECFFQIKNLYVKVFKKCFVCPNQDQTLFGWGVNTWKVCVGNRNGMRTILHRGAMLVVVGYAHLSWNSEFECFLFQLKIFMWKHSKSDFFVQITTKGVCWAVNTWKVLSGGK